MSENLNQKRDTILIAFQIIVGVALSVLVAMQSWVFSTVVQQGKEIAAEQATNLANGHRLDSLEQKGSAGLTAHVKEDETDRAAMKVRIEKLESAVLLLQTTPGELKGISARLDALTAGQARIESVMMDHMKATK